MRGILSRRVPWLCVWRLFACTLLGLALSFPGGVHQAQAQDASPASQDLLRLPKKRWVGLLVNVEEYYPTVAYTDHRREIRSLAVMPEVFVQVPDRHFRPYIGAGLGVSINGLPLDTPLAPLPLPIEDSLVMHVGGGFDYHLGDKLTLTGRARFAQFTTSDVLDRLAPSSSSLLQSSLDFSSYAVQLGIRLVY
jgi:hypothetical protein